MSHGTENTREVDLKSTSWIGVVEYGYCKKSVTYRQYLLDR